MIAVLDASAAIRLVTRQDADGAIAAAVAAAEAVLVPELFVAEVSNALWKIARRAGVAGEDVQSALRHALALPDRAVAMSQLAPEVLALALRLGHPTYDLYYLALARREAALLVTEDGRLRALCAAEGVAALRGGATRL